MSGNSISSPNLCAKCGSNCLMPSYTIIGGRSVGEMKCLICGYRPLPSPSKETSIASDRSRPQPSSRKRSRPPLAPRKPLKTADSSDRSAYAASVHFLERSQELTKQRGRSNNKSERARLHHYQALFDALFKTSERLRKRWATIRKSFLEGQRTAGHALAITDQDYNDLQSQYELLMRQAMVWQPDDPIVRDFLRIRRALGDYEFLRKARKGVETGTKRPYSNPQEAMTDLTILELGVQGMSLGKIQKALIAQDLPPPSREWIRKRLAAYSIPVTITVSPRIPRR